MLKRANVELFICTIVDHRIYHIGKSLEIISPPLISLHKETCLKPIRHC